MKKLHAIIEFTDTSYGAYLVEVDGVVGISKTLEGAKKSLEESISLVVEGSEIDGYELPEELVGEHEIEYSYDLATFLQVYEKILSKSALSRLTGINDKQLWHYAMGLKKPRPATVKKVSEAVHKFASDLCAVKFA